MSPHRPRALRSGAGRTLAVAIVLVLTMAASGLAVAGLTHGRGTPAPERITTASLARFHTALVARLRSDHLSWNWVVCLRSGKAFRGVPVVRCNVDFGIDPHVEAYCSVFADGRLETNFQDRAIPCGHDNAGYRATVVQYGG